MVYPPSFETLKDSEILVSNYVVNVVFKINRGTPTFLDKEFIPSMTSLAGTDPILTVISPTETPCYEYGQLFSCLHCGIIV
jgi:hypothetical protein